MSRPRVAYVADSTTDVRMLDGFARHFELIALHPSFLGARATTGVPVGDFERREVPGKRLGYLVRAAIWLFVNRRRYDAVLVLDNMFAATAANIGCLLARRPFVIQLGRPTEEYFRCRRAAGTTRGAPFWAGLGIVKALTAFNERRAAGVGATSRYVAGLCRASVTEVAPAYGIDLEAFSPAVDRARARAELGLPAEAPIALFRSRLAPEKDPETFLGAVAALRAQGRPVVALYVGAEHADFEAMGARRGVPVIGRGHVHPLRELPLYYQAADALVQTSRAEGLGMSPLEGLACGTPAVVSDIGGLPEAVGWGEAGIRVAAGDTDATAAAIARLLDNPDEGAAMAKRGREMIVEQGWTPEATFETWARLVRIAIGAEPFSPRSGPRERVKGSR